MRYQVQSNFKEIGPKGQEALSKKIVSIVGVGGLGSVIAEMLTRAGISLRLVDMGRIELPELQRQALFKEEHDTKFKAKEIKKELEKINSTVKIRTFHEELIDRNLFLLDSEVVIDCSGSYETGLLVAKHCYKKHSLISCRISGSVGKIFIADKGACFGCLGKEMQIGQDNEEGLINPTVHFAAAIIVTEALKILLKKPHEKNLIIFDIWKRTLKTKAVKKDRKCEVCK
jgi:molybdopterin/thiamine biosynthesis adenylyltransferase